MAFYLSNKMRFQFTVYIAKKIKSAYRRAQFFATLLTICVHCILEIAHSHVTVVTQSFERIKKIT